MFDVRLSLNDELGTVCFVGSSATVLQENGVPLCFGFFCVHVFKILALRVRLEDGWERARLRVWVRCVSQS